MNVSSNILLISVACLVFVVYGYFWLLRYGPVRGPAAALMRSLWLLPFLTLWIPQKQVKTKASSLQEQTISVFLDDSQSMREKNFLGNSSLLRAESYVAELESFCSEAACEIEKVYGSSLDPAFRKGTTPLREVLQDFLLKRQNRPWFLFSDGGVQDPVAMTQGSLGGFAGKGSLIAEGSNNMAEGSLSAEGSFSAEGSLSAEGSSSSFVVGYGEEGERNISLRHLSMDELGFAGSSVLINLEILRSELSVASQTVQLAVIVDGKREVTQNVEFHRHSRTELVQIQLMQESQGLKLIEVRALPLPGEKEIWDNHLVASVEILPHASGILHIQGSPSVDGRFLRRFLKLDPRFDVISFFILRDPWDAPAGKERELSLIPFPVDKLFNEELRYFDAVILQNFVLSEFISPAQQKQLREYVQAGGSILFLGGPRAFHISDLFHSPLEHMIPFALPSKILDMSSILAKGFASSSLNDKKRPGLPWYDAELNYTLTAAPSNREVHSSPAISLYNSVMSLAPKLQGITSMQGMHRMEDMSFSSVGYLPILNAKLSSGKEFPFLSASYVGKGRLIWVFSDSLWQVAMRSDRWDSSRDTYNALFLRLLRWLTRDEKNPPLSVEDFDLSKGKKALQWSASLTGVLVPHIKRYASSNVKVFVCGEEMEDFVLSFPSKELLMITGEVLDAVSEMKEQKLDPSGRLRCEFSLSVSHAEFGEEVARAKTMLSKHYDDATFASSFRVLEAVSETTGSLLTMNPDGLSSEVRDSLNEFLSKKKSTLQLEEEEMDDHYWFFDHWLYGVLLLAMPLEVMFRRRLFSAFF